MSKSKASAQLEAKANLFKALGHDTRLLIINLIAVKPRHGEELAAILNLTPATISHHLSKLLEVGLLKSKKDQYYQTYSLTGDFLQKTLNEIIRLPQPGLNPKVAEDAYRDKVLNTFFSRGRLVKMPAQLKKQQVVLEKIGEAFEHNRDYTEKEVNIILLDFSDDVATLRRGLISQGLMTRAKGIYRKKE